MFDLFKEKPKKTVDDLSAHVLTLDKESLHIILVEDMKIAMQLNQSLQDLQNSGHSLPPILITTSRYIKCVQIEPFSNKIDA